MRIYSVGLLALLFGLVGLIVWADEPAVVRARVNVPQLDVVAHDPVIVKEGDSYYLFTTGPGISVWKSDDFSSWSMQDPVFPDIPDWTTETVSGFNGHFWAPDISLRDGKYYLYYSVSRFGTNDSCIGLATNVTLDSSHPDYNWVDEGIVLRSKPDENDWNAIDPNLIVDDEGRPYLSFGSFWSGLKIVRLKDSLDAPIGEEENLVSIASRVQVPVKSEEGQLVGFESGNTAIEGPFIYRKGDFYYLFASVDFCCRGKESTYKIVVGRSKSVTGPYVDDAGVDMDDGGGRLLNEGDERWQGLGHNSVCAFDGKEYLVFHGYDGLTEKGLPKLLIEELSWSVDGWPVLSGDSTAEETAENED
ncbi:family 43 glycosylhydrolase [Pelagicoccus mobilis]|uniref:Family 43 glycosylhydrolase n=1 Tax=Pelagicoccus mobilis TaxID=415221 RepID=A0A934RZE8_9BACT|nr:family 43 glycosylhydrolase [Pelagicoccus mobilis]MBK1878355.1 family 43 glycosylhydrolase [Pelagicoccus mobilis]